MGCVHEQADMNECKAVCGFDSTANLQMKARIAELQQQVDASKAETQQMVLKLQEDMLQKLNAKESAINVLEGQAARMLNWGVRAITSRNNAIILREAMAKWRGMTLSQVEEQARERKVKAFVRRFLQAQLLRAWNSWQETVLEQRNIRTKTERAVRKLVHRHTSSAFLAWRVRVFKPSLSLWWQL